MAVMTKPITKLPVIDGLKLKEFLEFSNKNKASKEYLAQCHESAKLFKKKYNGK